MNFFFGLSLLSVLLYLNFFIMMSIIMASMFSLHPSELQHVTDMKDLVFALLVYKLKKKKKRFLLAFTAGQTSKLSASPFALDCLKGLFIYLFIIINYCII